jgi:hypothetical protein
LLGVLVVYEGVCLFLRSAADVDKNVFILKSGFVPYVFVREASGLSLNMRVCFSFAWRKK